MSYQRMSFARFRMAQAARLLVSPVAVLAFLVLPLSTAAADEVAGRILVKLSDSGLQALRSGKLDLPVPAGGETRAPRWTPLFRSRTGPLSRYVLLTYRPDSGAPGTANAPWLDALLRSSLIEGAESDQVFSMTSLPMDPYLLGDGGLPRQFHLWNPDSLSLEAARAWPFVPASSGVPVAILDTGVDWHHPDLGGPSPPETGVFWTNSAELSGTPGVDDDQNGFVDDTIGWDFVEFSEVPSLPQGWGPAAGEDANVPDNDPSDKNGHGTQVAGFVTALGNNGVGIAPGAPGVRLMPLRVGWHSVDGNPRVFMSFCARALEYAAMNGARVANCSWESQNVLGLGEALDLAVTTMDMVVVGAAGNSGTSSTSFAYLASRDDCMGVAGVSRDGAKAAGSNYGSYIDISGFYSGMPSTYFDPDTDMSTYLVHPFGGTSFSAPQAAALAAMLRAVDPGATSADVINTIRGTGQDLSQSDPVYWQNLGGGLLDYAAAVEALGGGWDLPLAATGLTPSPDGDGVVFFAGPDTANAFFAETGGTAPGWGSGEPLVGAPRDMLPLAAYWNGTASFPAFLFGDDGGLHAIWRPGNPVPGWPVSLPAGAGQPVAGAGAASREAVFVPLGDDVLELNFTSGGVDSARLGLPLVSLCLSTTAVDSSVVYAGTDTAGSLYFWTAGPGGVSSLDTVDVGSVTAGPVLGEFLAPGEPMAVVAVPDSLFPGTVQRLLFVDAAGVTPVEISAPPIAHLSLAGFNDQTRLLAVAADMNGDIHVTGPADGVVNTLPAGGPLAGEVLSADITGDYQSELIALRADGTLLAWDHNFTLVPGFPRNFPAAFDEPPVVADDGATRAVVLTDVEGVTWSLPAAHSGVPMPWPMARGNAGRTAFLSHARGTPVETAVVLDQAGDGSLCWSGLDAAAYVRVRLRTLAGEVLWQGPGPESRCVSPDRDPGGETVLLEGLDRRGNWSELARTAIEPVVGLRFLSPHPNPFRAGTRIAWSGARGPVRLRIFDVGGKLVRVVEGSREGSYLWEGTDTRGVSVSPGMYFLKLEDGSASTVRRVLKIG